MPENYVFVGLTTLKERSTSNATSEHKVDIR
jgi:hypothetical protein